MRDATIRFFGESFVPYVFVHQSSIKSLFFMSYSICLIDSISNAFIQTVYLCVFFCNAVLFLDLFRSSKFSFEIFYAQFSWMFFNYTLPMSVLIAQFHRFNFHFLLKSLSALEHMFNGFINNFFVSTFFIDILTEKFRNHNFYYF